MSEIKADVIYDDVIPKVGKDWMKFARKSLGLSEIDIEACEYDYRGLEEQRFQMVQTWMRNKGRHATTARLYQLVDQLRGGNEVEGASNQRYGDGPSPGKASNIPSVPESDVSGASMNQCKLDENPPSRKSSSVNEITVKESASAPRYDLVSKAFSKTHRRSESGATVSSSEDHMSSSGSIRSQKKSQSICKKVSNLIKGKNSKTEKLEPKSLTQDSESMDYCTTVRRDKVDPVTDEDMEIIRRTPNRYNTEERKGCALIINNNFPNDESMKRHGSEKDVKHMVKLWKEIGCDIYNKKPYLEQTADQMREILKGMTKPKKEYGYIVIVIMSHGELVEDKVFLKGADDKRISEDEIGQAFSNANAPRLRNIPKLFILQSCCGEIKDRGVDVDFSNTPISRHTQNNTVHLDGSKIPTYSDMLFAYSTHKGYAAIRHPRKGSWFITALTNVFMEFSRRESVRDMLLRVNDAMKKKTDKYEVVDKETEEVIESYNIYAMSYSRNSFTNKLFLLPGYPRKK